MGNQNLNQGKRIEPKIRVSKDGKWVIMNVPGIDEAIIKPVSYFKAILENAEKKKFYEHVEPEELMEKEKDGQRDSGI